MSAVGRSKARRTTGHDRCNSVVCAHAWPTWYPTPRRQLEQMCGKGLYSGRDAMSLGLFCKHAFCFVSVSLALSVLFVRVLYGDLLVHDVLAMHAGDGRI